MFAARYHNAVGYQISGDGSVTNKTKIVFVTTGYLLQVVVNMPERLREYTHLVLDEVRGAVAVIFA